MLYGYTGQRLMVPGLRAGTSVVWPVTMPRARFTAPLDGSAGIHVACSHRRPMDVIIMLGLMPVADDAVSILVRTELFVYRRSVWSRRQVGPRRSCGLLSHAWRCSGEQMERSIWCVPTPPVGREGMCWNHDAELSTY